MSLTDTTPFIGLIQRWAKKLSIFWVILILVGSSYFYINQPKFRASLNLVVPEKIQIIFTRNFELKGCTREGTHPSLWSTNKDKYGCYYGSSRNSKDWVIVLILPPIGLLTVSWLMTFFSRRMGE